MFGRATIRLGIGSHSSHVRHWPDHILVSKTGILNDLSLNKSLLLRSASCESTRRYGDRQAFHAAGKFCENQLKACSLDGTINVHSHSMQCVALRCGAARCISFCKRVLMYAACCSFIYCGILRHIASC